MIKNFKNTLNSSTAIRSYSLNASHYNLSFFFKDIFHAFFYPHSLLLIAFFHIFYHRRQFIDSLKKRSGFYSGEEGKFLVNSKI